MSLPSAVPFSQHCLELVGTEAKAVGHKSPCENTRSMPLPVFCFQDSWISQSASFPRNQKQPGVDSLSPVASLPKQIFQPSAQQQPTKPVKVTCANCKKPLQKGQTAYQRKGSAHLFCSTTCLSSFSHKPAPKKLCVMCKK